MFAVITLTCFGCVFVLIIDLGLLIFQLIKCAGPIALISLLL